MTQRPEPEYESEPSLIHSLTQSLNHITLINLIHYSSPIHPSIHSLPIPFIHTHPDVIAAATPERTTRHARVKAKAKARFSRCATKIPNPPILSNSSFSREFIGWMCKYLWGGCERVCGNVMGERVGGSEVNPRCLRGEMGECG